jgi:hypothetical protein
MNNLQDELAWLNHRLDNKLEEWRKLHRLHGRFNAFLVYCLLILIAIYAYYPFNHASIEASASYIIVTSFLAIVSLLVFSLLKWRLYHRLSTKGHQEKASIDSKNITSTPDKADLEKCQYNLFSLLRIERSFPISDYVKQLVCDAIKAFFNLPKKISQVIKSFVGEIQKGGGGLIGWAKGICAKIMKLAKCKVSSAIRVFSDNLKTYAKELRNILLRIEKKIEESCKDIKRLGEDLNKLEEEVKTLKGDVEELKQQVGQVSPEKP